MDQQPKVTLIDKDQHFGKGIKALCDIKSDHVITLYGISKEKTKPGTMELYIGGSFVSGNYDSKNKFALGQFANDNAYTPEIDKHLIEGNIHEAYTKYISNSITNNNATLHIETEPVLISKRDIVAGEPIYTAYGLSYWINTKLIKKELDLSHIDKFNDYALELSIKNLMIIYDSRIEHTYNIVICENMIDKSLKKIILIKPNKKVLTNGEVLNVLCNKFQIHYIYTCIGELPECIRESAYDTLLYWELTFNRIFPQNKIVIDDLFKSEKYDDAYKYYCELNYLSILAEFVSKEKFIKYYKFFTNLYTRLFQDERFCIE